MNVPDPVDTRLVAMLAEEGKSAVHELAGRLGMDPREVAARLLNLSATGLPLVVGAECDPGKLRGHIAAAHAQQQPGTQAAPFPAPTPGAPGQYQPPPPGQYQPPPPGQYQPPPPGQYQPPPPGQYQSPPPGQYQPPTGPAPGQQVPGHRPQAPQPALGMSTWGPAQSSAWARGDEQAAQIPGKACGTNGNDRNAAAPDGRIGEELRTTGPEGQPISIRLVEVVDPADSLYTAAGYTLGDTERAVVVHTELTNHGSGAYHPPPDQYLVLQTADGNTIAKAPISLASRPPHAAGVPAGQTVGGHTVYVLNQRTRIREVRWLARPDSMQHSLAWGLGGHSR